MFDKIHIKLAVYYTAIIMFLSIGFSLAIYKISTDELANSYNRQAIMLQDDIFQGPMRNFERLNNFRDQQIDESKDKLIVKLVYFNLVILILSLMLSYYLAQKTVEPIIEAMDAQDRFTADASHELRTPLTAMRTEIEVLLRDQNMSLDDTRELLNSNLEEIQKLEALSSGLLKLARQKGGLSSAKYREEELSQIVSSVAEKLKPLALKKEMAIELKLSEVLVAGEKHSLMEVVTILLDNAIKYSAEKSEINLVLHKANKNAVLKVIDRGEGIKATDLPHIFDRFYRVDHSRSKNKAEGYGLGLAIAKNIIEAHGGSIKAESRLDEGTVFTVILPAIS